MRAAAPVMVVGSVLWIVFGVFVMLDPWGPAEVYRPDLGYSLITDRALYLLYGIPGTAALALSSFGLAVIAVFGSGWVILGWRAMRRARPAT